MDSQLQAILLDEMIAKAAKLRPLTALALFDDPSRAGDVHGRLSRIGAWAAAAYHDVQRGAHEPVAQNRLENLVDDTKRLAADVMRLR